MLDVHEPGNEQLLIQKAQRGDADAFAELFQIHYSFLYKYILKMTSDPHIVEDILQETLLKGYLAIQSYDGRSKWSSWLITIATRTYVDLLRKKKREKWFFRKEKEHQIDLFKWQLQQKKLEFADVVESIARLDPDIRIPVLLKHYYGYSYPEIALILRIKEGTVKSRVHKGIRIIRKELDTFGNEEGR
ncbi:RNA polymerase sigma factor SigY [Bacillus testis]|uniref:RNA polymerase sigma factor SigY n=1 Tax=Bacillus testis TaxID=1622072 RepID=UPI00067F261F|nr:RNA polymerase sigma factor SigY [Bacillus testis]